MLGYLVLFGAVFLQAGREAQPAINLPFRVIVNSANSAPSMSRQDLSAIFTKRLRRWPDGTEAMPADLAPFSKTRQQFSRSIHGKSVAYVIRYWHRLIFSGRGVPPPDFSSEASLVDYVKANPGAVGYVAALTTLDEGVRELPITP